MADLQIIFEQVDASRYLVKFMNTDKHIPNMIADELNNFFSSQVCFAATRHPGKSVFSFCFPVIHVLLKDLDKPNVEMEIHLVSSMSDVAGLMQNAAMSIHEKLEILKV